MRREQDRVAEARAQSRELAAKGGVIRTVKAREALLELGVGQRPPHQGAAVGRHAPHDTTRLNASRRGVVGHRVEVHVVRRAVEVDHVAARVRDEHRRALLRRVGVELVDVEVRVTENAVARRVDRRHQLARHREPGVRNLDEHRTLFERTNQREVGAFGDGFQLTEHERSLEAASDRSDASTTRGRRHGTEGEEMPFLASDRREPARRHVRPP
ncbi:MAG: hypothetical protein H6722_03555 [Sandaracinus sp.]|nr:hypothetical protein [Sandaracinus sp.]